MSRCGACKYDACPGDTECIKEKCPLYDPSGNVTCCRCVNCMFDMSEECTMYTPRDEEENDAD